MPVSVTSKSFRENVKKEEFFATLPKSLKVCQKPNFDGNSLQSVLIAVGNSVFCILCSMYVPMCHRKKTLIDRNISYRMHYAVTSKRKSFSILSDCFATIKFNIYCMCLKYLETKARLVDYYLGRSFWLKRECPLMWKTFIGLLF